MSLQRGADLVKFILLLSSAVLSVGTYCKWLVTFLLGPKSRERLRRSYCCSRVLSESFSFKTTRDKILVLALPCGVDITVFSKKHGEIDCITANTSSYTRLTSFQDYFCYTSVQPFTTQYFSPGSI